MASLTVTTFLGVRAVFTLPPFFFIVEPVASKFQTQVLMAWGDGTAQLKEHDCDEYQTHRNSH
jgi:hypothetical protein